VGRLVEAAEEPQRRREMLGKLADLLDRQGIEIDDVGDVSKIKAWQGFYKDEAGDAHTVDMVGIQFSPTWESGPTWPVVQQAAPCVVKHGARNAVRSDARRTVLLPDPQIGYLRYDDGTLEAMHDEQAMACALELIQRVRPHRIVNLGDFLDLAEFSSKFAVGPEMVLTTQPAIDRGHRFLAEQAAAAGPQLEEHILLEGNHDDRLPRLIMQNAKAAMRLRQAADPEGWPVMSVPFLLRLDELGVTYVGGYPAGRIKVAEASGRQAPLFAIHGEKLDMKKQAKAERQSTVQGHDHHFSTHCEVYEVDGEAVEVEAWSMGCLCRTDGAVPSTKGGHDARGRPIRRHESWQQGVGVLTETADGWDLQPVRIRDGRAYWNGEVITC
jgi:hypothetical protein